MSLPLGVTYYPEHTDPANWDGDLARIRASGMSFVRNMDICWTKVEPREGVYTFDWLDDFLERCQRHGVQVVLSTPSAAPPPWLVKAYPEVQAVQADGTPFPPGVRRQVSVVSSIFRHFACQIATVMAKRYGHHPAVIGMQMDNELHGNEDQAMGGFPEDHSREAVFRFREWLKARYGTTEALNQAWGMGYWSQEFGGWDDLGTPRQPRCSPSWFKDFYHFYSDMNAEFLGLLVAAVRPHLAPGRFITHNWTSILNKGLDLTKASAPLDLISWDPYPYGGTLGEYQTCAMKHDLIRTIRRAPFWAIETYPSEQVSQACLAEMVAHGSAAIAWWPWRRFHYAQEKWHQAMTDAAGRPYPYLATVTAFSQRPEVQATLPAALPPRPAAWLFSLDTQRVEMRDHPHDRKNPSIKSAELLHRPAWNLGIPLDALLTDELDAAASLSPYRLLLAGGIRVVHSAFVRALTAWVEAGGILVATGKFGSLDPWGKHHVPDVNSAVSELVGYTVRDDEWVANQPLRLDDGNSFVSETWVEHAVATTAQVLGRFTGGVWDGRPAVLRHQVGKGAVYSLCATSLALNRHLMPRLATEAGVPFLDQPFEDVATLPHLVEPGKRWYFNYAKEARTVGGVTIPAQDFVLGGDAENRDRMRKASA